MEGFCHEGTRVRRFFLREYGALLGESKGNIDWSMLSDGFWVGGIKGNADWGNLNNWRNLL